MSEEFEEGTDVLDPVIKEQQEKEKAESEKKLKAMIALNGAINDALNVLANEHGIKLYVAGYQSDYEEIGIWKSKNVTQFDEMALSKLIETQF